MRITKAQLKRVIREMCGLDVPSIEPVEIPEEEVNESPQSADVHEMLVEMEVASRSLDQVVESLQVAAQVCHNCDESVSVQAPLLEAMVNQAEALHEMVESQSHILENASNDDLDVDVNVSIV